MEGHVERNNGVWTSDGTVEQVGAVVATIGEHDVLLGKGAHSRHQSGNQEFRANVKSRLLEYNKASDLRKNEIANDVVAAVHSNGGHFWEKIPVANGDASWERRQNITVRIRDALWERLGNNEVLKKKAKQRFRDARPKKNGKRQPLKALLVPDKHYGPKKSSMATMPRASRASGRTNLGQATHELRVRDDATFPLAGAGAGAGARAEVRVATGIADSTATEREDDDMSSDNLFDLANELVNSDDVFNGFDVSETSHRPDKMHLRSSTTLKDTSGAFGYDVGHSGSQDQEELISGKVDEELLKQITESVVDASLLCPDNNDIPIKHWW